jgi:hypothetical protein
MKAPASVVTLTAGAILAFAVTSHPAFIDLRLAGLILMAAGALGLWPAGGRAWLLLGRYRLRKLLDETAPAQGARVPLHELLHAGRPPAGDGRCLGAVYGAPKAQAGSSKPQEVTSDD